MTADARDDILGRLRRQLGRSAANTERARAELRAAVEAHARGPLPELAADAQARFLARAAAMSCTVEVVPARSDAPAAVARYLAAHGLAAEAVCAAQVARLPWREAGVDVAVRAAREADLVGITGCFCAIADTGTLMLCGGPDAPAAVSLLPETHIALVPAARIVPLMEDAWALLRAELGEAPRAVNFVSGPSRTGDIELTIVLGAHGPYRVHIVVVDDRA